MTKSNAMTVPYDAVPPSAWLLNGGTGLDVVTGRAAACSGQVAAVDGLTRGAVDQVADTVEGTNLAIAQLKAIVGPLTAINR